MEPASDLRAGRPGADTSPSRHLGLDGLRGLAVAWVVAFHLWPDAVPGGWLGVGLFFTLSGYLVVGLIDTEVSATGRLRLGRFMARRVRRLMPAALLTIVSVLVLTAVLDDQAMREVGLDALAAVLNVFNWRVAADTAGYAVIFEDRPEPFAHFWSLAIEEQFYLLVPAAVALTRRTAAVVWAMALVGLVGVGLWWGSTDAYVATPVRALEIAAGAGLALAAARSGTVARFMQPGPGDESRPATRIAGGVILAVAAVATVVALARLGPQDGLVFRGGPQLMALCWVVWVVAAVRHGIPSRIMSAAVLRWLGTRSYAIYLAHWPLIELADWHPVAIICATTIAAEVSYRVVEMPVRRGTGRRALPLLGGAALAVGLVAASMAVLSSPDRAVGERAPGADELPAWALEDPEPVADPADGAVSTTTPVQSDAQSSTASADVTDTEPSPSDSSSPTITVSPTPTTQPTTVTPAPNTTGGPTPTTEPATVAAVPIITVIGDSTGVHIADGLRQWADANRSMAVVDRSQIGCYPLREDSPGSAWRMVQDDGNTFGWSPGGEECRNYVIEPGSDLVLVVHHGAAQFDRQRNDGSWASILDEDFASGVYDYYRKLIKDAQGLGAQVVFASAPPLLSYLTAGPQPDPEKARVYNSILEALATETESAATQTNVALIDTATALEDSGHDGRYSRSDGFHLDFDRSELFAAEVLGPALLDLLTER